VVQRAEFIDVAAPDEDVSAARFFDLGKSIDSLVPAEVNPSFLVALAMFNRRDLENGSVLVVR